MIITRIKLFLMPFFIKKYMKLYAIYSTYNDTKEINKLKQKEANQFLKKWSKENNIKVKDYITIYNVRRYSKLVSKDPSYFITKLNLKPAFKKKDFELMEKFYYE